MQLAGDEGSGQTTTYRFPKRARGPWRAGYLFRFITQEEIDEFLLEDPSCGVKDWRSGLGLPWWEQHFMLIVSFIAQVHRDLHVWVGLQPVGGQHTVEWLVREDARRWLKKPIRGWPFSVDYLTDLLGLDLGQFRRRMLDPAPFPSPRLDGWAGGIDDAPIVSDAPVVEPEPDVWLAALKESEPPEWWLRALEEQAAAQTGAR